MGGGLNEVDLTSLIGHWRTLRCPRPAHHSMGAAKRTTQKKTLTRRVSPIRFI